jgi:hypothetical protein
MMSVQQTVSGRFGSYLNLAWGHDTAHHHVGLAEVTPNEVAEPGNLR